MAMSWPLSSPSLAGRQGVKGCAGTRAGGARREPNGREAAPAGPCRGNSPWIDAGGGVSDSALRMTGYFPLPMLAIFILRPPSGLLVSYGRRSPQTLGVSPSRRDNVGPRHHREIQVPELSRFFGIIIAMYYNDHSPPHFHAKYGGEQASIRIDHGVILESALGARAPSRRRMARLSSG